MSFSTKKRYYTLATAIYLVCAVLFATAHFFILHYLVDPTSGFYAEATAYPTILAISAGAISFLLLVLSVVFRPFFATREERHAKEFAPVPFDSSTPLTRGTALVFSQDSVPNIFASSFLGFSFLTFSILLILEPSNFTALDYVCLVFSFLSGFSLLLQFSKPFRLYSSLRCLSSLLPAVWGVLSLVNCFLKASRSATGEYHEWQILTLAMITLFFYFQSKFTFPRRVGYQYHALFTVGLIAVALILCYSFATILVSCFWLYTPHESLYTLVIELAIGVYILVYHFTALKSLLRTKEEAELMA